MKQLLWIFILLPAFTYAQTRTLSGHLTDGASGEDIIGATIYVKGGTQGTASDFMGNYSLKLPAGKYTIIFSLIGFSDIEREVDLTTADQKLDLAMETEAKELEVVEIKLKKNTDNIEKVEMSTVNLDIKEIEKIPALLGEADVIKSIQLLPGVSTVGEGATGFNVRGGSVDQNLVLLDDAPIFNSSHLFGFFSVFNPDAVQSVKLIKGGIPSQYGGRLSSILDVKMKDGNDERFGAEGGIGLLFSRLTLDGPIKKGKGSFVLAGRRSYADVIAKPFLDESLSDAKFFFYDLTGKANYQFGEKDKIYYSGYYGKDVFGSGFFFNWGNATSTLRWNHIYNEKLFSNVTVYFSDYTYELGIEDETGDGFGLNSQIINYAIKPEWTYYLNDKNTIKLGLQSTYYTFRPGESEFTSGGVNINLTQPDKYALESGVYADNEQKFGKRVVVKYGLRFSSYQYLGRGNAYNYADSDNALDGKNFVDSTVYGQNEVIQNYNNLEPRLSLKVDVDSASSIKASYNRMVQYIHLMSNTAAATPLDIWTPSTNNIRPQIADQFALGYFRNFGKEMGIETSVEAYYKILQNQIGYIPNANLILNEFYEADLLYGGGRAYGLEFLVKKTTGKLTGWVSYTLSRSEIQIDALNNGDYFPSRFDRTHVGNLILSYAFTKRHELSANFVYNTGIPATFSPNSFEIQGYNIPQNPSNTFNNSRVSDYHRLDLSFTIYGKKKEGKRWQGDWVFSVYNVYNRRNAFTIFLDGNDEMGQPQAIRYSIIGSVIPSITYNFKF